MTSQPSKSGPLSQIQHQMDILKKIPDLSKIGFSEIADQMGIFSVGFASGATQASTIRERVAMGKGDLGLKPLRDDHRRITREIKIVFESIEQLIEEESTITQQLGEVTTWAMSVEQDVFLPTMTDQLQRHKSKELEQNTLGSIIDSLMHQVRTLIHEIITSTLEASNLLNSLNRRLSSDMETSKLNFKTLKAHSNILIKQLAKSIKIMDFSCREMEDQTNTVNNIVFEMIQDMQYDDITAQRIDHMLQTLTRVNSRFSVLKNLERIDNRFKGTQSKTSDKRWITAATNIVIEHLEETSTDVVTKANSLQNHLIHVSDLAKERKINLVTARDCSMSFRQDVLDLSYHLGTLLHLGIFDDGLSTEVLRRFSHVENTIFQAKRSFELLALTSTRLNRMVSNLDADGSPRLESLKHTISTTVERIQEEGSKNRQILDKLTNHLQHLSMDYSEKATPKIMRMISLLRRAPLRAHQMESDNNDVLEMLNETLGDTQAIYIQIMLLGSGITFHDHIKKHSNQVVQNLQTILSEKIGDEIVLSLKGNSLDLTDEFKDLASMYTMASERRAHDTALGDTAGDENEDEDEDEDEDDDGFELF